MADLKSELRHRWVVAILMVLGLLMLAIVLELLF